MSVSKRSIWIFRLKRRPLEISAPKTDQYPKFFGSVIYQVCLQISSFNSTCLTTRFLDIETLKDYKASESTLIDKISRSLFQNLTESGCLAVKSFLLNMMEDQPLTGSSISFRYPLGAGTLELTPK